eukprot:135758-Pyramimonas_sp.AAC.1
MRAPGARVWPVPRRVLHAYARPMMRRITLDMLRLVHLAAEHLDRCVRAHAHGDALQAVLLRRSAARDLASESTLPSVGNSRGDVGSRSHAT